MFSGSFDEYFYEIYGTRWSQLRKALQEKEKQILRINKFSINENQYSLEKLKHSAYWLNEEFKAQNKEITRDKNNTLNYYIMDPASYLAADSLPIEPLDKVLDMCAAPGGKSLILAEKVFLNGELIANELSESRRERLIKVIQNYIPRDLRSNIWVKGWDAQFFGMKMTEQFDKILLDAPCSGERHQLENLQQIKEWSLKKSQKLAQRQYSLLASAYLAVKSQGLIMYSTCSINPMENDQVIAKLLKKKKSVKPLEIPWPQELKTPDQKLIQPEPTEHGYLFLPDKLGFGPIYVSLLQKI
ncbi:MAG: RsmB/NOP family class I SAM-dependent RNA methyltransferase [Bdellovibrionales bacterium]|nr:RsmB/NOP family class I SAM-dependent RNA methyltransferase [Bdellovibrionales bacterium]